MCLPKKKKLCLQLAINCIWPHIKINDFNQLLIIKKLPKLQRLRQIYDFSDLAAKSFANSLFATEQRKSGEKRPGNFPDYITDLVFFCNSFLKRFLSKMVGVAGGGGEMCKF